MKTNYKHILISILLLIGFGISAQTVFTGKPMYQVLTKRGGIFLGTFTVELFPNIAPKHVRNFDSLVNLHFYDSTAFHRCIPNFMIQGGDPNSRHGPISTWGYGQPGQTTVPAEFTAAKHLRGTLSAARSQNINSATSQFFICVANYPSLNGNYSVYGRVIKGMNYVDTIVLSPKTAPAPSTYSNMPLQKIEMFITAIGSNDTIPNPPTLNAPPNYTVGLDSVANQQLKWNAVSDGIIYQVHLSTDSLFVNDTVLYSNSSNLFVYKNGLKGNTRYFWRVRTNNGGHFSAWSAAWNFHTAGETTGINSFSKTENNIVVYPNPSKGIVNFEQLEEGSHLMLYDPSGKQVFESTCEMNKLMVNLEKKEKGVYIYKLSNKNGKTITGKFLVQ